MLLRQLGARPDPFEVANQAWLATQISICKDALRTIRSFVPVDVSCKTVSELMEAGLNIFLAQRFNQSFIFRLFVTRHTDIQRMHIIYLRSFDWG